MGKFQSVVLGDLWQRVDPYDLRYWDPRTEDPYTDPAIQQRMYNQVIGEMSWQDLLRRGFQVDPATNYGTHLYGENVFDTLSRRIEATGWDDAKKKTAIERAINGHYDTHGSGFTEWSQPEGIASLIGIPDHNANRQAAENQQFIQQHAEMARLDDADSLSNALTLGSGILGAGLGFSGGLDFLLGEAAGGVAPGLAEELAALTGSGGAGGAGAVGGAAGGLGSLPGIDPSWGVNPPSSGGMPVTPADPFAYTPEFPLGDLNVPTEISVPGVDLSTTFPATGVNAAPTFPSTGFPQIDTGLPAVPPAGVPGATGGVGTPAATPGQGTAISRVIDALTNGGTPAMADILSIGGTLGSTLLGMYGSNQQGGALRDIANQSRADRQPFLNKSLEWLNNPSAYAAGPGAAFMDATLDNLSPGGNPFGMPYKQAIATQAGLADWRNAVTGFGNIGLSGQDSRNQLLTGAAQADSGALNSLGYGLENLLNPRPQNNQLNNLLRQFGLT